MSLGHIQTPFSLAMTKVVKRMVQDAVQLAGKALPVQVVSRSGAFVTVSFQVDATPWTIPQIEVPILMSQYVRLPIRAGDPGVVISFDTRLTNITGQGGIVPKLDQPGNLSALAFLPVTFLEWPNVESVDTDLVLYSTPDCVVLVSPSGVRIKGQSGSLVVEGNISAGTGASGTVTTGTGQVLTFQDGICTNIF